jgi:hypothetical protein
MGWESASTLYFSRTHGTCLSMNREVLTVTRREDGRLR